MSDIITIEECESEQGRTIPQLEYDIARSLVSGMAPEIIAEAYGFEVAELTELIASEEFNGLRGIIAARHHELSLGTDDALDALENTAAKNLLDITRLHKSDGEFNLKVLAVANKAQRRNRRSTSVALDPAAGRNRVSLKLSQRVIDRINGVETERSIEMVDTNANDFFERLESPDAVQVGEALGVTIKGASEEARDFMKDDEEIDSIPFGVIDAG